jgi:Tfp pilus assembly protein PilN
LTNRLNLASKPFTNRALPWAVTAILVFFSLLAMVFIARSNADANAKAAIIQREINDLNQQKLLLSKDIEAVKNSLTPEQQLSLKSAHELVDRKRFSWSLLFADLEGVLPQSVRVARIAVRQVHSQGDHMVANLELTVIAKSPTAVTDMIAVMDKEGIFQAELHTQSLQKGRGESGSEYELLVQYTPPGSFASSSDDRAANNHSPTGIGGLR